MKVERAILITAISIFIFMIILIKILGSTNIPVDVEKNGYCKQYGNDWKNIKGENICRIFSGNDMVEFTEQEFRDYCPKNNLISTKFYSDCFHKSGGI